MGFDGRMEFNHRDHRGHGAVGIRRVSVISAWSGLKNFFETFGERIRYLQPRPLPMRNEKHGDQNDNSHELK